MKTAPGVRLAPRLLHLLPFLALPLLGIGACAEGGGTEPGGGGSGGAAAPGSGGATTPAAGTGGAPSGGGTGGAVAPTGTGGAGTPTGSGGAPPATGSGGAASPGTGGGPPAAAGGSSGLARLDGKKVMLLDDMGNDPIFEQLLRAKGVTLTVGRDAAAAATQDLVVISSSVGADEVVAAVKGTPAAIICFGKSCAQPLDMLAAGSAAKPMCKNAPGQITIVDGASPLTDTIGAGTSFEVAQSGNTTEYCWGPSTPAAAIKVASIMGSPAQLVVFAYEKGAMMATGPAPGRRVTLHWKSDKLGEVTLLSYRLFNAALEWALGAR